MMTRAHFIKIAVLIPAVLIACPSRAQSEYLGSSAQVEGQTSEGFRSELSRVFELSQGTDQPERALYISSGKPKATLIMLAGGEGNLGLGRNGAFLHGDNFVVRTRGLWVARNYAVLIPDTIGGVNLRGIRSSAAFAARVREMVDFAHEHADVPVFLLGTSQGSIAAMNGASHAKENAVAGVIFTESVSRLGVSKETVFDGSPQDVRVPALIVSNIDDHCDVAPPEDASRIAASMIKAPSVRVISVSGGVQKSDRNCGSLSPHGYYGIEREVIDDIDGWMEGQLRKLRM